MTNHDIKLFSKLIIESHSYCNRSCWFCPRTYDRSGDYLDPDGVPVKKKMSTETIIGLLDQAKDLGFRNLVAFFYYSEPLEDDRALMLARLARERGMKPYIHTNGDRLRKNEDLCRQVEEVFEYVVIGIYDYKTSKELEESKTFWRERMPKTDLRFSTIGLSKPKGTPSTGIPKALVPSDQRFIIPDLTFVNAPCHQPTMRMIIRYDGKMVNCCEDMNGSFDLGNVYENTLGELWYSDKHQAIVKDLIEGQRQKYALCANCPMPPSAPPPAGRKASFALRKNVIEV